MMHDCVCVFCCLLILLKFILKIVYIINRLQIENSQCLDISVEKNWSWLVTRVELIYVVQIIHHSAQHTLSFILTSVELDKMFDKNHVHNSTKNSRKRRDRYTIMPKYLPGQIQIGRQ